MTAIVINGRTVILQNADTNPLRTITPKKAFQLVAREKAVIVETDPTLKFGQFALPLVVRLKEFIYIAWEKLNGPPKVSKRGVILRDKGICAYCRSDNATTIDHVQPRSKGGKNTWENLVAACLKCNHKKGNRTPEQASMKLLWKGYAPTRAQLHGTVLR